MGHLVWAALGVIVYAGAHLVLKSILDFRAARGAIAHALAEFANVDTAGAGGIGSMRQVMLSLRRSGELSRR